jgi:hypothetical protein
MPDWQKRVDEIVESIKGQAGTTIGEYAKANTDAVIAAIAGRGPDDVTSDPTLGARAVCNIPAVHVRAFCEESARRSQATGHQKANFKPYKNGYDLGKYHVGQAPGVELKTREVVDAALPLSGHSASDVYFAAVELNGPGVRFYGDICLVLRPDVVSPDTAILESNSYDLVRAPLLENIESAATISKKSIEQERRNRCEARSGKWEADLARLAALKVIAGFVPAERRLTTGNISNGVLTDEDYIEVLKIGTFGAEEVGEARVTAGDIALEGRIGSELREGRVPSAEEILWRQRRRDAFASLRAAGIPVTVVTTTGRVRSS